MPLSRIYKSVSQCQRTRDVLFRNCWKTGSEFVSHRTPGQVIHPFYRVSGRERLLMCYGDGPVALADGRPVFASVIEGKAGVGQLVMGPVKLQNKAGVSQWLKEYTQRIDEESAVTLQECHLAGEGASRKTLLTRDDRRLQEVVQLLEKQDPDEGAAADSVALNSLIDYILISRHHSGLFAEDIYSFILGDPRLVDTLEKVSLVIESVQGHMYTKLDHLRAVEPLLVQALQVADFLKNCTTEQHTAFDFTLDKLFQTVNRRFNYNDCLRHFEPHVLLLLLRHYLHKSMAAIRAKTVIERMIQQGIKPPQDSIDAYLRLLESKSRKEKLVFIADFRPLIENAPSVTLLSFCIALCQHYNEIMCLVNIVMKQPQEQREQLLEALFPQLVTKCEECSAKGKNSNLHKSADLCGVLNLFAQNNIELPSNHAKLCIDHLLKYENLTMAASLARKFDLPNPQELSQAVNTD
ncbi:Aep1p KNAG_0M02560 [Huiozyma naganishii CBS 8797]|uniref:ATPase expression protein 1 n=1 Tax=Huiozyma naganishii (strain ATCC MYA-139 / BCRC 22969 / CBS 8797 / KCTC 17520 / NBRC 10181 / NCYC 3082 / Yp74L-3) TaxID=1071383 RepID=J7SAW5_HUIN7|nr:hypothetical protein KNAG_0M02560 [Kazachstania naganishii CBS 8797]CCK73109.1 hypothetical protein KNAG_0M02560 [Kazachstania naganishii CBS 8797]